MPPKTYFVELRSEIKVTETRKQYMTLRDPKCIHTTNLGSLPQIILEICSRHNFSRIEARGQGHSDPKIVCNTLRPQGVSTHQIWDSYLKKYRRYALYNNKVWTDGRTVQKLYAPQSRLWGPKKSSKFKNIYHILYICDLFDYVMLISLSIMCIFSVHVVKYSNFKFHYYLYIIYML